MTKTVMIDFPILNEGFTVEDRADYAKVIGEIGARHGVNHVARYDTVQHLTGSLEGTTGVNLWEMKEASDLEAVLADEEYAANVGERDRLHNMDRLTMFLATQTLDEGPPAEGKLAMVDVVVLNEGKTLEDRAEYSQAMAPLAEKYGAKVVQSYRIDRHLRGELSTAVEVNIWELPDAEVFAKLTADPAYEKNVALRDEIHDMNQLTMILALQHAA